MGPYPFVLAAALVAGLLAGLALGTVRLTRLTLGLWRTLRSRWRGAAGGAGEETLAATDEPQGPPGPFPRAHGAVLGATIVAALLLGTALALEPAPLPAAAPLRLAPWSDLFGPRTALVADVPLGLVAFGLFALVVLLATALVASALDRAVHRLARPLLARVRDAGASDLELSFADLRASALGLWGAGRPRGEPFGVGLGYVALFASPAAALALLLSAPHGRPEPAALVSFAAAFLIVPLAYAAAAERSQRGEAARLRRRAAMRQLLVAPLWLIALLVLLGAPRPWALVGDGLVLALVLPFALPGASPAESFWNVHRGGDLPEASPVVRAITGLAHHAWMGAWAALVGLAAAPASASLVVRLLAGAAALLLFVLVRAAVALAVAGLRAPQVAT